MNAVDVSVEGLDVSAILNAADRLAALREESKLAAERLRALLPFATPEQFAVVASCAREEKELPEGCKIGEDFVLTDGQQASLEKAREERKAYLARADVKERLVGGLLVDQEQVLTSFKVRVGTKKTTTTARFEKGRAGVGLIAKLRAQARG